MRTKPMALVFLFMALYAFAPHTRAQDKPKSDNKPPVTTLKLQVVFSERDGETKLANLPYTFFLNAAEAGPRSPSTRLRMGSRVPVYAGKDGMQYIDVGTNIDARGLATDDGRFDINLSLERSWVEGDVLMPLEKQNTAAVESTSGPFKEPIIRQFKTELTLTMKDGQTVQTTQAADPLSGRILTISVTMSVVK